MTEKFKQSEVDGWVKAYSNNLYGYAVQRVKDTDIAKDLVQETYLAAWRNYENYKGEASVKNWLFIILKSKLTDHYRKVAQMRMVPMSGQRDEQDSYYFNDQDHWKEHAYPANWSSDKSTNSKDFYRILHGCKKKLNELQDTVFSMKYLDGLESDENCKVRAISASNYWVLFPRAKMQLRKCPEKIWI